MNINYPILQKSILFVGPNSHGTTVDPMCFTYMKPFSKHGTISHLKIRHYSELQRVRLAVFTGGEDVNPAFYGEERLSSTYFSEARDAADYEAWVICQKHSIPTIGICRGAQFLNVMNGGALIQHADLHTRPHQIVVSYKQLRDIYNHITVSSTHHQIMVPPKTGKILAYATHRKGNNEIHNLDPEVVFFPNTKSLCVQFHPERAEVNSPESNLFQELLSDFLSIVEE